ncbi:GGDEF domain-containing protein [Demequina sp. SO4-18]|uniref:GGDEF domain-containing protein n=1 Tax=Demequina sp. SO4-18 TaxID=3401026 RepID=UPI003B5B7EF3
MLDDETMRIALGGVSLTVLVLFYLGVYRPTRSSFSGWWSVSLLCAGSSTSLLLFNGTGLQVLANPGSTALSAIGVTCVWFATRSLRRGRALPLWLLAVAPAVILVPTLLQNPAENVWAGNGLLFSYMGMMFVVAATEVWLAWRARASRSAYELNGEAVVALLVSAIASSALGAFYVLRAVLYYAVGPEDGLFELIAGTAPTTGILLVCLVAVTFSVSAVGWDQQTQALRRRAMEDDLTGLLGRTEFRLRAEHALSAAARSGVSAYLAVADLDHFKVVNDVHGHAAGDRALVEFAQTVRDTIRPDEIAGRLGGEEFGLVLIGEDAQGAAARLDAMSEAFAARSSSFDFDLPTVSYGLAGLEHGSMPTDVYERADLALYRAKDAGRNQVVAYRGEADE